MTLPAAPVPVVEEEPAAEAPPPGRVLRLVDVVLRVVGGLVAVAGGVLTALIALLLSTVRVGGQLIGVSVVVTIAGAVAVSWFAYATVGRRWAVALPALPWFVLMAGAAVRTAEGDLLVAGENWVGLAMITTGAMTFAVMAFRQILSPQPRRHDG
ncbi:hypothetical protein OG271_06530 [Micromonospora rifamycinica]|uniref:hypothetical protein n=1 Tax=Micromonospora rifamycinica TaxID=291594 RepID=UPI002E2D4256|nr:hypothetical protein [Micromonospora rifamycinica]